MNAIDRLRALTTVETAPEEEAVSLGRVVVPGHIKIIDGRPIRVKGYTYVRRGGKRYRVKRTERRAAALPEPRVTTAPAAPQMQREGNVVLPKTSTLTTNPVTSIEEAIEAVEGAKAIMANNGYMEPAEKLDHLSAPLRVEYLKARRKILLSTNKLDVPKGQKISVARERGRIETVLRATHLNNRLKKGTITPDEADKELAYLRTRMGSQPVSAKDATPKYKKVFGPGYPLDVPAIFGVLEGRVEDYVFDSNAAAKLKDEPDEILDNGEGYTPEWAAAAKAKVEELVAKGQETKLWMNADEAFVVTKTSATHTGYAKMNYSALNPEGLQAVASGASFNAGPLGSGWTQVEVGPDSGVLKPPGGQPLEYLKDVPAPEVTVTPEDMEQPGYILAKKMVESLSAPSKSKTISSVTLHKETDPSGSAGWAVVAHTAHTGGHSVKFITADGKTVGLWQTDTAKAKELSLYTEVKIPSDAPAPDAPDDALAPYQIAGLLPPHGGFAKSVYEEMMLDWEYVQAHYSAADDTYAVAWSNGNGWTSQTFTPGKPKGLPKASEPEAKYIATGWTRAYFDARQQSQIADALQKGYTVTPDQGIVEVLKKPGENPEQMMKAMFVELEGPDYVYVTGPNKVSYVLHTEAIQGKPQSVYIGVNDGRVSVRTWNSGAERDKWEEFFTSHDTPAHAIAAMKNAPSEESEPVSKSKEELIADLGFDPDTASKFELMAYIKAEGGAYVGTMSKDQNADWVKYHTGLSFHETDLNAKYGPGTHEEQKDHLEAWAKQKQLVSKIKAMANKALKEAEEADAGDPPVHPLVVTAMADAVKQASKVDLYQHLPTGGWTKDDGSTIEPNTATWSANGPEKYPWRINEVLYDADGKPKTYTSTVTGETKTMTKGRYLSHADVLEIIVNDPDWAEASNDYLGNVQSSIFSSYLALSNGSVKPKNNWIKARGGLYTGQMDSNAKLAWAKAFAAGDQIALFTLEQNAASKSGWIHKAIDTHPGSPVSPAGKKAVRAQANFMLVQPYGKYLFDAEGKWIGDSNAPFVGEQAMPDDMAVLMAHDLGLHVGQTVDADGLLSPHHARYFARRWAAQRPTHGLFRADPALITALTAVPSAPVVHKPADVSDDTWEFSGFLDAIPDDANPFVSLAPKIHAYTPKEMDTIFSAVSYVKAHLKEQGVTDADIAEIPLNVKKGFIYAFEGGDESLPPPPPDLHLAIAAKVLGGKYKPTSFHAAEVEVTVPAQPVGVTAGLYDFLGGQKHVPAGAAVFSFTGKSGFGSPDGTTSYMGYVETTVNGKKAVWITEKGFYTPMPPEEFEAKIAANADFTYITNPKKWVEPDASVEPAPGPVKHKGLTLAPGEGIYHDPTNGGKTAVITLNGEVYHSAALNNPLVKGSKANNGNPTWTGWEFEAPTSGPYTFVHPDTDKGHAVTVELKAGQSVKWHPEKDQFLVFDTDAIGDPTGVTFHSAKTGEYLYSSMPMAGQQDTHLLMVDDLWDAGHTPTLAPPSLAGAPKVKAPVPTVYVVGTQHVTVPAGGVLLLSPTGEQGMVLDTDNNAVETFGGLLPASMFKDPAVIANYLSMWDAVGDVTPDVGPKTFTHTFPDGATTEVTLQPGEQLISSNTTGAIAVVPLHFHKGMSLTYDVVKPMGAGVEPLKGSKTKDNVDPDLLLKNATVESVNALSVVFAPAGLSVGKVTLKPGSKMYVNPLGDVLVEHLDGSGTKYFAGNVGTPKEFGVGDVSPGADWMPLFAGTVAAAKGEKVTYAPTPVAFAQFKAAQPSLADEAMWDWLTKIEGADYVPGYVDTAWLPHAFETYIASGMIPSGLANAPESAKKVFMWAHSGDDGHISAEQMKAMLAFKADNGHYGGVPVPAVPDSLATSEPPPPPVTDFAAHIAKGQTSAQSVYAMWPPESITAYAAAHGLDIDSPWTQSAADDIAAHLAGTHPSQQPAPKAISLQPPVLVPAPSKNVGGLHSKNFWKDENGDEWMTKPHTNDPNRQLRAEIEDAANRAGRLFGFRAPRTHAMKLTTGSNKGWNYVQEWIPDGTKHGGDFIGLSPSDLSDEDLIDALSEHVLDWLISNHDTHEGNLLFDPEGRVYGIDKGQAFKFFGSDKLAHGYRPAGNGAPVWYDRFYSDIQHGKVTKERLDKIAGAVHDRAAKMATSKDAEFKALLETGLASRTNWGPYEDKDDFIDAVMARKAALADDFEEFYQHLYTQGNYGIFVPPAPGHDAVVETVAEFAVNGKKIKRKQSFFSGVSAASVKAAVETKAYGVPMFFAGTDIEDAHAITFAAKNTSGVASLHSHLKLRKDADAKLTQWIKAHDVESKGAAPTLAQAPIDPSLELYGEETWFHPIVAAAKTVSHHTVADANAPSGFASDGGINQSTINQMNDVKTSIKAALEEVQAHMKANPAPYTSTSTTRPSFATLDQQAVWVEMAETYLGHINDIDAAIANTTKAPKIPAWTKKPKKQAPVDATYTSADGTKLDVLTDGTGVLYSHNAPAQFLFDKKSIVAAIKDHKLTEGEASSLGTVGAQAIKLYKKSSSGSSGNLDLVTGELTLGGEQGKGYTGQMYEIHVGDDVVIEYQPWNGEGVELGQQGSLKITVNNHDGASTDDLQNAFDLLTQMGLAAAPATEEDMEIFYWRHLSGVPGDRKSVPKKVLDAAAATNAIPTTLPKDQQLEEMRKAWKVYLGGQRMSEIRDRKKYMPQFLGGQPESSVQGGRPIWMRPDTTAHELLGMMSKPWLTHHVSGGDTRATMMAQTGGLISTEERLRLYGQFMSGMSSGTDQGTGGSAVVYTRLNNNPYGTGLVANPFSILRSHTYGFNGDRYGNIKKRKAESPYPVSHMVKHTVSNNETVPKYGLTWDADVEFITFEGQSERDKAVKALKDRGITHIRGLPVEERLIRSNAAGPALTKMKDRLQAMADLIEYGEVLT